MESCSPQQLKETQGATNAEWKRKETKAGASAFLDISADSRQTVFSPLTLNSIRSV